MILPVAMTWDINTSATRIGATQVSFVRQRLDAPRGLLARYACAGCGFVEVYCEDPESVPVGPEFATDIVEVSGRL